MKAATILKATLLALAISAVARAAAPPATIEQILAAPELRNSATAIVIWDLDTGETIYERGVDRLLIPASNMKLVTAGAALITLGTEYQFRTDFYVSGWNQSTGVAKNLYVIGGGDPSYSDNFFESNAAAADDMAAQLARYGLRAVTGNIYLDDSRFSGPDYPPGWASDDSSYCYGMRVAALSIAENCIRVKAVGGGKAGDAAQVTIDPPLSSTFTSVSVTTSKKGGSIKISQDASGKVKITGGVAPGRAAENEYPVPKPALLFGNALAGALQRSGISFSGTISQQRGGAAPAGYTQLASLGSPYISEILGMMLKKSDNFIAEMTIRTLGSGQGGSTASGTRAATAAMRKYGIASDSNLVMYDGSGLSRNNKLTPRVLMSLLKAFYNSYLKSGMTAMMAEPGGVGTLKKRLVGTPAQGRLWAKTGALRGACALSGYYRRSNGDMAAFSMIMNGYSVHSNLIRALQDRIVLLMLDQ